MEDDAAEAAVRVDAVDLDDGVVGLLGVAVGHVVHVEYHLLHLIDGQPLPLPLASLSGDGGGAVGLKRGEGSNRRRVGDCFVGGGRRGHVLGTSILIGDGIGPISRKIGRAHV